MDIDTADIVKHRPTGEEWIVAGVKDGRLMWCGWPPGTADVTDCELVEKATPEQRDKLLHEIAAMHGDDQRKRFAMRQLGHNYK
jgi:hypothetical protein